MRLSDDQLEELKALERCTQYTRPEHARLVAYGLAETGKSRFAHWTRITQAGREFLAGRKNDNPGAATGPAADAGHSLRGAVPRSTPHHRSQARRVPTAISPPADALDVGVPSMTAGGEGLAPPSADAPPAVSIPALMRELTMKVIKDNK